MSRLTNKVSQSDLGGFPENNNESISAMSRKDGSENQKGSGSRLRNFKKQSSIYGIPVKNTTKIDTSIMQSSQKQGQELEAQATIRRKDVDTCDLIILNQESPPVYVFNFFMILFALISTLCAAYYACFGPPDNTTMKVIDAIMEICFALDILRNFITQYEDVEEQKTIRNLKLISKRYLKGDFIVDLIAISRFPLNEIFKDSWEEDQLDLLYMLRLFRLYKVLFLLNTQKFQGLLKRCYSRSLNNSIEKNPRMEPMLEDNNKIMRQIYIMYIFRVLRLVLFILILSYFLGTFWYIITKHTTDNDNEFTFYNEYGLEGKSDWQNLVIVVYFAFTTLSTVGFGDYNPKSEVERIVTTFILLVGVACFSYIMGQFIDILMNLQNVTADNEDSENLSKWLGLLAHFNRGSPLPKEMTKKFERYFEYYWANDKNYAIKSEIDVRFMTELPNHIQTDIYRLFLFADFIYNFKIHFRMLKESNGPSREQRLPALETNIYGWEDTQYSQFMILMLQSLEPRFYSAQEYIFEEDDEVNEQIYVISQRSAKQEKSGKYCIGFSDQKQRYFHVKLGKKTIIGGYENLFGYKSEFFYKALHHIDAYGLRKEKLQPIMDKYPEFRAQISQYMVNFYYRIIKKPMLEFKRNILSQVRKRQDMDQIIKEVDIKIKQAEDQFQEEFNRTYEQDNSKNDETHRNVQKLENKVNNLAKSVHDLFVQFDELSKRNENSIHGGSSNANNNNRASPFKSQK